MFEKTTLRWSQLADMLEKKQYFGCWMVANGDKETVNGVINQLFKHIISMGHNRSLQINCICNHELIFSGTGHRRNAHYNFGNYVFKKHKYINNNFSHRDFCSKIRLIFYSN
jgi:hypothetical protein